MPCFLVAGRASRGASAAAMDAAGAAAAESQDAYGAISADAWSESASAFALSQDTGSAAGSAAASAQPGVYQIYESFFCLDSGSVPRI